MGPQHSHDIKLNILLLHAGDYVIQLVVTKLSAHVRQQQNTLGGKATFTPRNISTVTDQEREATLSSLAD